jgi:hypothetical protein
MPEINGASVLGFVPSRYPAGIILAERWDREADTLVTFTAEVESITESDEWTAEEQCNNHSENSRWALIERASR